jgi:transcriptional regulator with XRE-family HTH domain
MKVGSWIREQRIQRKLSQVELATLIRECAPTDEDMPRPEASSISRWESGKVNPELESFRRLCLVFEASADEALGLPTHCCSQDSGAP